MIGRFAWWAVLAAIGIVTGFAQIDRSARFTPHLASLVPPAFSGFAAEQRTRQAIAAQQPDRAIAEAKALVAARPLPAENLALFAIAAAMNEQNDQSIAAIEAASTRGWRAPIIQQAVAQAALEQGEYDRAAQRIAALLATGSARDFALDLAARLTTTQEGQAAFARQYAAPGHWQDNAVRQLGTTMPAQDFAATLAMAEELGASINCGRLRNIIQRYEREGQTVPAARLREICPD
ncbi:hypothetical protein [Aurantiacibacter marinus]|uniref:hypothetical protein n=1 Tax=Aurantiacibacter marinus TaxID=874156 RepID=UPI000699CF64|nr:hypothetical protein [Aurantiacibacter marinus]